MNTRRAERCRLLLVSWMANSADRTLLNSFVLLGLAVEAGTPNQPTIYIEKAAELERPDMMGFTVPDGLDPDGCDVASNLRQGGPDQQVEEMGRSIDRLAR